VVENAALANTLTRRDVFRCLTTIEAAIAKVLENPEVLVAEYAVAGCCFCEVFVLGCNLAAQQESSLILR
jgi:hypothetical protein